MFLLLTGTSVSGFSQPNWKDSVKIKQKISDAYYLDNLVYFKTKKGWGVYNHDEKKQVIEPVYQFVKVFPGRFTLFVKNNKVGMMDMQGNVVQQPVYTRLGKTESYGRNLIRDNNTYTDDTIPVFSSHYMQLWRGGEFSIAVNDGKVFVNESDRTELNEPMVLYNAIGEDSLDKNGNAVYAPPQIDRSSGIFDLKTGKWIFAPGEYAKVGFVRRNMLLKKETVKNGKLVEQYSVMTPDQNISRIPEGETEIYSKKSVSLILSDYQPAYIYCRDSVDVYSIYLFESGGKYGLYSQYTNTVLHEPVYDFVTLLSDLLFTVKNGKAGAAGVSGSQVYYDNLYRHLTFMEYPHIEASTHFVNCDDNIEPDPLFTGMDFMQGKASSILHNEYGLSLVNGKVVVHDFVIPDRERKHEIMQVDEVGEPMYMFVDGFPGSCRTGVFDPAAKKWLVPQQFSIIQPYAEGYACLKACNWQMLYSYYNKEGKAVFTDKTFEEIKKEEKNVQLLSGFGKGKTDVSFDGENEYDVILRSEGKSGVFCLENLKWKVEPVYQYIGHHALNHLFTVVDSGKIGILNFDYSIRVPVKYQRINLLEQNDFLCANDTFLYRTDSLHMKGITDTAKLDRYRSAALTDLPRLNVRLEKNKLIAEEVWYNPNAVMYDDWGNEMVYVMDTSRSFVADVVSGQQIPFKKGWMVNTWDHGFMTRDASGMFRSYDAAGKNPVELVKFDSAAHNQKMLWVWEPDKRYFQDPEGKVVVTDEIEDTYFAHKYTPVGNTYSYYNGKEWLKGPEGFRVMCAGQNGLLLGYNMLEDQNRETAVKKYQYYDLATKQYSPVELELTGSMVNVYPVKDGFVLFNYDHAAKLYNCMVLNADLKTVKSTFRKLKTWKANVPRHMGPSPWFELHTDKKIMYFNKDFQFIHECNYQDQPQTIYTYNRTILKSRFKTIVMDWEGNLLKQ